MPRAEIANGRLDSWKDIAAYLRRDVRTAIRWEKDKGLPVRRVPGGQRKAVFAYRSELDSWLRQEEAQAQGLKPTGFDLPNGTTEIVPYPESVPFPKSILARPVRSGLKYAVAASLLAGVLLFALYSRESHTAQRIPVRTEFTLNGVRAFDDQNQVLWTHTFPWRPWPSEFRNAQPADFTYIDDFRGKGDQEALMIVPYHSGANPEETIRTEIDLFSSRGDLLWSYVPHGHFQFGKHELDQPWVALCLFVSRRAGKKQIWVAVNHTVWGNSFIVSIDPETGKDTLRFVNTGSIRALNELTTSRANYLLVGGFNNEPDTGSLAVIDEAKPFAASPQSEGTRHKCLNCPAGDPDSYFVFPRSELNQLEGVHETSVQQIQVQGNEVLANQDEADPKDKAMAMYLLRADTELRLVSRRFNSGYEMLHRRLEQEGKIAHKLADCPEPLHPKPVKMWTPTGGWSEIQMEPSRASE